jgi:hypothetical protein
LTDLSSAIGAGARGISRRARQPGLVISTLILFPLLVWAIFNWSLTVREVTRLYADLPMWDYFNEVEHYPYFRALRLGVFWQQHNEHRVIFPEIIFALDMLLFRGRQIFTLVASVSLYFGIWVVMAWTLFQDKTLPPVNRYSAILIAAIIAGWKGSAAAIAIPFLLQWPCVQISVVLALLFLALLKPSSRPHFLVLTILSGIAATYSSGNGILLWPILIAGGFVLRLSWKQIAAIAIAGVLSVGLYFVGYKTGSHLDLHALSTHPFYLLYFVAFYLAMPFSALSAPWFGVRLGIITLVAVAGLFVVAIRSRLLASIPGIVLFGYCAFAILSALITASGRMNPADPMIQAAGASRYLTVPLLYWSAGVMAAVWIIARRFGSIPSIVVAVVLSLLLLKMFPKLERWYHWQENAFADQQWAALCVETGITDRTVNAIIYPDPGYVSRFGPILRENRLAVFAEKESYWIGRPLKDVFSKISPSHADGEVTFNFPIDSGVALAGWIDSRLAKHQLVFVDESNRIVGLGKRTPAGMPPRFSTSGQHALNWVGFLNLAYGSGSFSTYVVDDAETLVPLGGKTEIPAIQSSSRANAGETVADIQWVPDNGWVAGLLPSGADTGDPPAGLFLSSWNHDDASTGVINSSTFATPDGGCLIWPILHGPVVDDLEARIIDVNTGATVVAAPLRNQDVTWNYWRVALPPTSSRLKITARDAGRKWGEWLAVAAPAKCR